MKHISLAIVALVLSANAPAEKCVEKTEPYEGRLFWSAICVASVEDVIKADLDGYLMIHYIVQYRGQRFVVEDPLVRTDYGVGEPICFAVNKLQLPEDPRHDPRYPNLRFLNSVVVYEHKDKAANEECQKMTDGPARPRAMNMDPVAAVGWESWPADIALREVTSFAERGQNLVGLSEAQLKRQLGFPGEESPGTRMESASHEVTLADRDLRYFDLLPHVIVSFSIAGGVVAFVGYMPKWRRCPPEFVSSLGGAYAPE